jgi:hypothetical protein
VRCNSISLMSTAGATVDTGHVARFGAAEAVEHGGLIGGGHDAIERSDGRAHEFHAAHQGFLAGVGVDPVHDARHALEGLEIVGRGVGLAAADVGDDEAEGLLLPRTSSSSISFSLA